MKCKIYIFIFLLAAVNSFVAKSAEISTADFHKRLIQKSLKDENWTSWQTISDTHSPADYVRIRVVSDKDGVSFVSEELGRAPRGYDKNIELSCEEGKYDNYGKNYSIKGKTIEPRKEYDLVATSVFKLVDDIEYAEEGGPHKFMVSFNDCKIINPRELQETQSSVIEPHNNDNDEGAKADKNKEIKIDTSNARPAENTLMHTETNSSAGVGDAPTESASRANIISSIGGKEVAQIGAKASVDDATRSCKPDILLQSLGIGGYAKVLSVMHKSSFGGKQTCHVSMLSDGCIKSFETRLESYLRFLSSSERNELNKNNITGSAFAKLNDTKTWPSINYRIDTNNTIEISYVYPFKIERDLLQFIGLLKTACYLASASDDDFKYALADTIKYNRVAEISKTPASQKTNTNSDACNNDQAKKIIEQLGLSQVYRVEKSFVSAQFNGAYKCRINAVTKDCISVFSERIMSFEKSNIGTDKMVLDLAFMKRGPNIGPLNYFNLKRIRPWKININYKQYGQDISELMVGDSINELGTRSFQEGIMVMNAACKLNTLPDSEFGFEIMNIAKRGVDMKYLRHN